MTLAGLVTTALFLVCPNEHVIGATVKRLITKRDGETTGVVYSRHYAGSAGFVLFQVHIIGVFILCCCMVCLQR